MIFYISPLIFSVLLGVILSLIIVRNLRTTGARALLVLILSCTLWSFGYIMEIVSPDFESKVFWAKFQYFGIVTLPLAWYLFAIQQVEPTDWSNRSYRNAMLLAAVPIATLFMVWTNDSHHLVWQDIQLQTVGTFQVLHFHHGPWFWVFWLFSYVLMILGTIKLVRGLFTSDRYQRWQIGLMLVGCLFPWVGNFIYVTHLNPLPLMDWTPFAFTIAGLLFTISLFRYKLVNILPIARQTAFSEQRDCLIVIDLQDCIVDLNQTAQEMVGSSVEVIGKPLASAFKDLLPWVEEAGYTNEYQTEISLGMELDQRFFDLRISPLRGAVRYPIGRLIVLHDVTQHRRDQTRLEQIRSQLEDLVSERTETLRVTIEQLQYELAQRSLAEKRFEEMVESAPDALLLADQAGKIILANEQAQLLYGYPKEELLGMNISELTPMEQGETIADLFRQFVASSTPRTVSSGLDVFALRKDGLEIPVEVTVGLLKTESGYWVACDVRDISQRLQVERELRQIMEEIQQSRQQLQALTFRLHQVRETERRQIAAELHDGVGQNLTGINLNLQLIENQLRTVACADEVHHRLEDSQRLVEETTRQVRNVMAYLHPPMLDEYGLVSAIHWYGNSFAQRTGLAVQLVGNELEPRLPQNVEIVLFRIVQEALTNVAKHAKATRVMISVEATQETARVVVEDNGVGFDPSTVSKPGDEAHWGIINMQQRAASINGSVEIESTLNWGTRVVVSASRRKQ